MRLLLVDDDRLLAGAMSIWSAQLGFAIDRVASGEAAQGALRSTSYDGILMDLGLPDIDGAILLKRVRAGGFRGPVIVISARAGTNERIQLLDVGADDYVVKPFDLGEIAARLRAIARRGNATTEAPSPLEHGALTLTPSTRTATWCGRHVVLTNKEFWLLEVLLRRKDRVVSRSQLEESLYGWGDDVGSNTVEVYVHHLRRKFWPGVIRTVRGSGYCIGQAS